MITKQEVLAKTNNGQAIFQFIFKQNGRTLKARGKDKFANERNPFYQDKNGSLSIYLDPKYEIWCFWDHGNPEYKGDAFDFAALYYELNVKKDFPMLLAQIYDEMTLAEVPEGKQVNSTGFKTSKIEKAVKKLVLHDQSFDENDLSFWKQYGVTEAILKQYNVVRVQSYVEMDEEENELNRYTAKRPVYAFMGKDYAKLYSPDPKAYWYAGNKPKDYMFGYDQTHEGEDLLIITGGEKDVLSCEVLGYKAICLSSETAEPSRRFMRDLYFYDKYQFGTTVAVMYDTDEAGLKNGKRIADKYGLPNIILPSALKEKGGKDVSDWIKLGLPIQDLHECIKQAVETAKSAESENRGNSGSDDPPSSPNSPESSVSENEISDDENYLFNTPIFPAAVYNNLPGILKDACSRFNKDREKDLMLLGSLGVISCCLPKVVGYYDNKKCQSNLFFFIVAPASAGKGSLDWARYLIKPIHKKWQKDSEAARKQYKQDLAKYKSDPENFDEPEEPKYKVFIIPGNSSSSAILKTLFDNGGRGIIFETEADSLSGALGKEWGGFDDVIRKAFHHEAVSYQRTGNGQREIVYIESPFLSMCLSGTPGQVSRLIPSIENGLLSRIGFYAFDMVVEWKKGMHKRDAENSFEDHFNLIGEKVLSLFLTLDAFEGTVTFETTEDQQNLCDQMFDQWQQEFHTLLGIESIPSIRRLGVIQFRIAMILTALRLGDSKLPERIICSDADFKTAMLIIETLKEHSVSIFRRMPVSRSVGHKPLRGTKSEFYNKLPKKFTRAEALKIAGEMKLNHRTADKWLASFVEDGLLNKPNHNDYVKP